MKTQLPRLAVTWSALLLGLGAMGIVSALEPDHSEITELNNASATAIPLLDVASQVSWNSVRHELARASLGGQSIELASDVGRQLRYGSLMAANASGRVLASHFEVPSLDRLRRVVDDPTSRLPSGTAFENLKTKSGCSSYIQLERFTFGPLALVAI